MNWLAPDVQGYRPRKVSFGSWRAITTFRSENLISAERAVAALRRRTDSLRLTANPPSSGQASRSAVSQAQALDIPGQLSTASHTTSASSSPDDGFSSTAEGLPPTAEQVPY
jgi:hypothetical protein